MTDRGTLVNDIHAQLNATRSAHHAAGSVEDVRVRARARARVVTIAIAGGRHAMGGQQFGAGLDLLDMTGLTGARLRPGRGEVEAEAGIMWPALIDWLHAPQDGQPHPWGIIQKQTGADRLTLGGALSSNVHGRVLGRGPIVDDVVAFTLIDADGVFGAARGTRIASSFGSPLAATGSSGRSSRSACGSCHGARFDAR